MDASPPWKILGNAQYRLGRNQEMTGPRRLRSRRGTATIPESSFSHDTRSAVELFARAESPFEFEPSREIELASREGDTARSGNVLIRNRTSRDRTVEISVPPEIASPDPDHRSRCRGDENCPAKRSRPSSGHRKARLASRAKDSGTAFPCGFLRCSLSCGSNRAKDSILGTSSRASATRDLFESRTRAEAPLGCRATAPNDLLLVPDPNTAVLQPGETRIFEVALEPSSIGDYRSQIVIDAGSR